MSSRYQYTTMDRVFSKIDRDLTSDFSEDTVIEWTGEALEFIGCAKSYEERVYFATVKNHQCVFPKWCHAIIQLARDNVSGTPGISSQVFTAQSREVVQSNQLINDSGDLVVINSDVEFSNNIGLNIDYKAWVESGFYRSRFSPIRLATHNFFNTVVCEDRAVPYNNIQDEYSIIMGNILRFSFQEGMVAIAYLQQAVDKETGWPLIPDHVSYLTAIVAYVNLRMAKKAYVSGRQGAADWSDRAERDWQWYCKQASNVDMMPFGEDEHQNSLDQRSYLLPRNNKYFGFFGNLNKAEVRTYDNPRQNNPYSNNKYY